MAYSTLRRWRARRRAGQPILRRPGPPKSAPLPFAGFRSRVAGLIHRRHRSRATGQLHADFAASLSRRDLDGLVARLRALHQRHLRDALLHLTWHLPNLAWAIDAALLRTSPDDPGLVTVLVRDLASHFHFEPLLLPAESAQQNLRWLQLLFARHGPPLFLKRDNGAPFNERSLNDFLAHTAVIPLNSPIRRPAYNGAIENGVRAIKLPLLADLDPSRHVADQPALPPLLRAAVHLHNATPSPTLAGLSPIQAYFRSPHHPWPRHQRRAIFEWISAHAQATLNANRDDLDRHDPAAAWRKAVLHWLRCQHLITVAHKPQPSPIFASLTRS